VKLNLIDGINIVFETSARLGYRRCGGSVGLEKVDVLRYNMQRTQ
jgi:hypothetical protein